MRETSSTLVDMCNVLVNFDSSTISVGVSLDLVKFYLLEMPPETLVGSVHYGFEVMMGS